MSQDCKPIIDVGLGIVVDSDTQPTRILVSRRPQTTVYAGYWEFPGGKVHEGETPAGAIVRELREELAVTVETGESLSVIEHVYDHAHVRLHAYLCTIASGQPENRQVAAHRWVKPDELATLRFPEANATLVEELLRRLGA
jgi:8-oxo-dGTP diphosphatase